MEDEMYYLNGPDEFVSFGKCADCGTEMNEGEAKTFTVCDACFDKHYKKIVNPNESTSSQESNEHKLANYSAMENRLLSANSDIKNYKEQLTACRQSLKEFMQVAPKFLGAYCIAFSYIEELESAIQRAKALIK